jgi:hypothetical protein
MKEVAQESHSGLRRMGQGIQLSAAEMSQLLKRIYDRATRAVMSCCTSESARTLTPPGATPPRPRGVSTAPSQHTGTSSSMTLSDSPHPTPTRPWRPTFIGMPPSRAPGPSSQPAPVFGFTSQQPWRPQFDFGASSSQAPPMASGIDSKVILLNYTHVLKL